MGGTRPQTPENAAAARGDSFPLAFRGPLVLVAEALALGLAASSVKIPPLLLQLFRALLTF
jgi:hypothetical protein